MPDSSRRSNDRLTSLASQLAHLLGWPRSSGVVGVSLPGGHTTFWWWESKSPHTVELGIWAERVGEVANRLLPAWKVEVANRRRVGFGLGGGSMRFDFDAQEAVRFVEAYGRDGWR